MSYVYDEYVFHYVVYKQITFLCMADDQSKRRIPFAFLEDIQNRFISTYGDRAEVPPSRTLHRTQASDAATSMLRPHTLSR